MMTEKDLTVRELYEMLEPLLDDYGDLKINISYDSGLVATSIKNIPPTIDLQPMKEDSRILFEGY